MKSKLIFAVIVILSFSTFAQVPRTVLMEYATNASCAPCASTNPYSYDYLKNNYGRMVSIWYHAWWPGSDDPMYVANKIENENRINYYNINGVPNYIIDGVLKGYRTEYTDLNNDAESRFAITSPVKLDVNLDIVNDSLDVTVTMVIYGDVTQENLKLRTAIIEQMLLYDNPPGSNGEVEFPHVFRKFIDGVAGIDITNLNIGDSLTYNMKVEISPEWKKEEISIVTFLQSHSSKEVIQAATDRNLHSIRGETPKMELVSKNESINYPYTITNYNNDTLKLAISLDVLENNQNWLASLKYGGNPNDTIIISLASQEVVSFELDLYIDEVPDYIRLKISAVNIGNETNYTTSLDYLGLVKDGKILLIDDDGGRDFQSNFIRTLNKNTIGYTKIDQSLLEEVRDLFDMPNDFGAILWNLGNYTPSLEGPDISMVQRYLNDGGRVLISGSDFAHDIHEIQNSTPGKFFFRNYLDATYLTDSVTSTTLSSVSNNPLFDTLNIQLNSQYPTLPDGIESRKGQSHMIMKFDNSDYYGIILRELNEYKTAYITFGLEQIDSEETQDLVVEKILEWFEKPVVGIEEVSEVKPVPNIYALEQNYPNPFNPSTIINYQLPEANDVRLVIFDILGNEIANLVNERKDAGYHSVEFDGNKLSSGIYFYSISAGSFYQVNKMLLLK